jgi:GNAT superfamily N-acetyltransferase
VREFKLPTTAGEIACAFEKFDAFYDELGPLSRLHWQEVAKDKAAMQLDIDTDYYRAAEQGGAMAFVTARCKGKLVGYVWWLLYRHPHYKTMRCAQGDVHFLLPEYRRGMAGYLLLKKAVELIKTTGVKYCYLREKVGHEHPAMMRRLGFKPLDATWSCDLTGASQ